MPPAAFWWLCSWSRSPPQRSTARSRPSVCSAASRSGRGVDLFGRGRVDEQLQADVAGIDLREPRAEVGQQVENLSVVTAHGHARRRLRLRLLAARRNQDLETGVLLEVETATQDRDAEIGVHAHLGAPVQPVAFFRGMFAWFVCPSRLGAALLARGAIAQGTC